MAIIQASTVLSLAEKVSLETTAWFLGYQLICRHGLFCTDSCFAVCCPLVDSTDWRDRGSASPEDDGPRNRDGEWQQSCTEKKYNVLKVVILKSTFQETVTVMHNSFDFDKYTQIF